MIGRLARLERNFRRTASRLDPSDLQNDGDVPDSDPDPKGAFQVTGPPRFLGYYGLSGITHGLQAYGILKLLADRGFSSPYLQVDLEDPYFHRLWILTEPQIRVETILVDLAVHRAPGPAVIDQALPGRFDVLVIDWLTLQNPTRGLDPQNCLPGQRFPGLGIGLEVALLLSQMALRIRAHGLLATPAWYHNAALYSRRFHFVDPAMEGQCAAIARDLAGCPIGEISWAIELGCLLEVPSTGPPVPFVWKGKPQIWGLDDPIPSFFTLPSYLGIRDSICRSAKFVVDRDALEKRRRTGSS